MTLATDRRRTRRHYGDAEHGIVAARVRPGHDAALIDVSAGGALLETAYRLLPGTMVELYLCTRDARAAVRGRVLRCVVAAVGASALCYRGAIGFDRDLTWLADDEAQVGAETTRCVR
jgi:hypothetical protein